MLLSAAALLLAGQSGTDREVLGALDALKQAVVTKDRPALAKLLHADLTYGHTDGHLETRDQVLERVTDSKVTFGAIDVSDAVVRVYCLPRKCRWQAERLGSQHAGRLDQRT